MTRARRAVTVSVLCLGAIALPGAARAAEPIMPLDQVTKGMHCTARTVISGIAITTFDVEVLDVVAGDAAAQQPYILFRASGPAVDATGIGPGFSGSPVSCPGPDGVARVAGAISEGIGEYGNKVGLATPIELVLGEPVEPPAETRVAPALVRAARPLATPMSIGGLSPRLARAVQAAARKVGRVVYAAPAAPRGDAFPALPLQGGSAMAVGLASGDVTAGAIGTVTYVDGPSVWAFGHPLDAAGRRNLFLQDAYVYAVINNPIGSEDLTTYKLAAPGHDLGTLTNDAESAVVGRLGALPQRFPLKIVGHDLDRGTVRVSTMQLADETALGLPTGSSALTQVGSIAIGEVANDLLHSVPRRQSGSMCVRIQVTERPKPLRFCNDYTGSTGADTGAGAAQVADFAAATGELDAYNFGPLHITSAEVNLKLRRSLRQAFMIGVTGPVIVHRGHTYKLRMKARRVNGGPETRTISVRVPGRTPLGTRRLQLTGTPGDASGSLADALGGALDLGALLDSSSSVDTGGPHDVAALADAIAAVGRYTGITASFPPADPQDAGGDVTPGTPEADAQEEREVYKDPDLRFSGQVALTVTVLP